MVFDGLSNVAVVKIENFTKYYEKMMLSIEFKLNYYLIYNSNIPAITNLVLVIQQTEQSLLSQCIFNSTVKINSIAAPLILNTYAILKTDVTKKKRILETAECANNKKSFSLICSNTQELLQCDLNELKFFLESYINLTVNKNLLFKIIKHT